MPRRFFSNNGRARLLVPVGVLALAGVLPASIGVAAPIGASSLGPNQLQTTPEQAPSPSPDLDQQARQIGEQVGQPVGEASPQPELRFLKDVSGVSEQSSAADWQRVAPSPSPTPEAKSETASDEFRINKQYLLYGFLGVIAVLLIILLVRR